MPPLIDTERGPRGTGLIVAPINMRSIRYRLIPDPTAVTIDWNAAPSLAAWRTEVEDQGAIGSCVSQTVTTCCEMLRLMRGLPHIQLNRNWVYFYGRGKAGLIDITNPATWDDTGMWADAGFDVSLAGVPREALDPYVQDAKRRPPTDLDADARNQDDLLSHRGVFRDDPGGLAGGLIVALQASLPVAIGMYWGTGYHPDTAGFLPDFSAAGAPSAHEITCWKRIPQGVVGPDWYAVCRNSWGRWWTEGRRFPDPEMEPGDFLLPGKRFEDGTVIDVRAASQEAVPEPPPLDGFAEARRASAQLARTKSEAMYQMERDYYAQNLKYQGDQAWWSAVQLEIVAGEIEALQAPAVALQPRGPGAA